MGCLMRFGGALLAVLLLAAPVVAHHVPVPAAVTDAEAFAVAQAEWRQQDEAFTMAYGLYVAATSAIEKLTALNDLETLVTVSVAHFAALDVRECFRPWYDALTQVWELLVRVVVVIGGGEPLSLADQQLGMALNGFLHTPAFAGLFRC